jgi:hypothetical protein
MKTFREFYIDAYQLNEFRIGNPLNNPLVKKVTQNPVVRTTGRVLGGALNVAFNRALGVEKATTDDPNIGPIERGLGAASAITPPGVSQATGLAHNVIGSVPALQKVDKRIGKEHEKAYKANPQAYAQMLGRSF